MKITPLDIRRKEFKRSVRGYSDEEVDIFLDEVADEFERLFQENMELKEKLQRLDDQIADHAQLRDALEKTLVSAQLQAEELRANAHKERELILRDAEMKARDIVNDSYGETKRTQQALVQLKMLEEDFRVKFRSLLEGYLRLLNEAPVTPASPGSASGDETVPERAGKDMPPADAVLASAPAAAASSSSGPAADRAPSPAIAANTLASSVSTTAASPRIQPAAAGAPAREQVAAPGVTAPEVTAPGVAAPVTTAARPSGAAGPAPTPAPASAPDARSVTPPAKRTPAAQDDTPTEESEATVAGVGGGNGAREDGAEGRTPRPSDVTLRAETAETAPSAQPKEAAKTSEDEPLRRFFFGRQIIDVDDTFQTEDVVKKDRSREFEW